MRQIRKVGVIAVTNLRRFVRDRSNLFFSFVLPLALIMVVGLQFSGSPTPRLGVAGAEGGSAADLVDRIAAQEVEIVTLEPGTSVQDRIDSNALHAVIEFPPEFDEALVDGRAVDIVIQVGTTNVGPRLATMVDDALIRTRAGPEAVRHAVSRGAEPAEARAAAERHVEVLDRITVTTTTTGDRLFPEGTEGIDVSAPGQLVLFVILTGLSGSYALIVTRKLGLGSRMMTSPTPVTVIIVGEAAGRLVIGLVQGLYVLFATMVLFGMSWGDPVAAAAVVVALAAVSAGAAMCFGTFLSNPESASGLGVVVALSVGALGGAMLPIELFSDTLVSVARFTPHYWALDAFAVLIRHDGGLGDIVEPLAVLFAMAVVLMALASWRMRSVLTRPG